MSQLFSQIFGNYHHKISNFDRKNHKKKNREILEGLPNGALKLSHLLSAWFYITS